MSHIQNRSTESIPEHPKYQIKNAVVNYFLLLMFSLFPLYLAIFADGNFPFIHFDNAFGSIRHDKYYLFLILTGILLVVEVMLFVTYSEKTKSPDKLEHKKSIFSTFSFVDYAMLALLLTSAVSALFSPYIQTALFGEPNGRNNGLLLIVFYVIVYFLITRFYYYMEYVFAVFAAASAVVYLLSVLNGFYIDPLGTLSLLSAKQANDFISTIGNKNLLSSYICISLPIIVCMSVHSKNKIARIIYLVSAGFGFMSLMVSDSDSGILGIGVFLSVYLIVYSRKISRLKRYFLTLSVMLASAKILRLFSLLMGDKYKEIGSLQQMFVFSNQGFILLGICALITVLLYLADYKKPNLVLPKAVPVILSVLLAAAVIGVIAAVIYFSTVDTKTNLGSFERLLRFNDKWGTHRGYMWIRSMQIFGDASIWQKLFGTGPDTFYYPFSPYFEGLQKFGDSSTNAAHNEYINYLITTGIFGLAAYLAFVGGAVVRAVKTAARNPIAIVFIAAVAGYSAQAFVNISQPITTPLFIIFVALCEAVSRKSALSYEAESRACTDLN